MNCYSQTRIPGGQDFKMRNMKRIERLPHKMDSETWNKIPLAYMFHVYTMHLS